MAKPATGEGLERETERLYRLLGAHTSRRVLIKTYEIDVLAVFHRGPLTFTVIVECKEYSGETRVSDEDMRSFVVKLLAARECGRADKGVFVTTTGYSKNALATAEQHGLQCLTLADLYDQLVDFEQYVTIALREADRSPLLRWYVEQTGSDIEDYDTPALAESSLLHRPLTKHVDQIFTQEGEKRLALLGNFGTGKTSFCEVYRAILLRRYQADRRNRIPILIRLRDLRSGWNIQDEIASALRKLPGVQIDLQLSLELQRMGRFLFILDGLDEMATKVDRGVINECLRELDALHAEGQNLYLVTCRTHFFQERVSDEFLRDYHVVYLVDWGARELAEYLQKRIGANWQDYLARIQHNDDLRELSRTPMLLDMITRNIDDLSSSDTIDLPKLYARYTDEWIVTQSGRRGAVMGAGQRLRFVEQLAAKLFIDDKTSVHYSDLYELAREFSGYGDATRLDYFDTDARTSTFITRDGRGYYGFRHSSFKEYFSARAIVRSINLGDGGLLGARALTPEVLRWCAGTGITSDGRQKLSQWSAEDDQSTLAGNAINLLLLLGIGLDPAVAKRHNIDTGLVDGLRSVASSDSTDAIEHFFKTQFGEFARIVRMQCLRYGIRDAEVDEIANDVLLKLWTRRRSGELAIDTDAQRWVAAVVRNTVLDRFRIVTRRHEVSVDDVDPSVVDDALRRNLRETDDILAPTAEDLRRELKEILDELHLDERARRVVEMRADGQPYSAIGEEMRISEATARQIFVRARWRIMRVREDRLAQDQDS